MLVVEDREEPGAKVGTGLPQVLLRDGAFEAALNEIVGAFDIMGERTRIAPQPWDLFFEQLSEIVHRTSVLFDAPGQARRLAENVGR